MIGVNTSVRDNRHQVYGGEYIPADKPVIDSRITETVEKNKRIALYAKMAEEGEIKFIKGNFDETPS